MGVIENLWSRELPNPSALQRAIALQKLGPKARLQKLAYDPQAGEIVRQLAEFDKDGRTDELLRTMHDRFPDYPGREEWPRPDSAPAAAGQTTTPPVTPVNKPTLATAILLEEPEISPTELAERVGVSRGTLYGRSKKWKHVRDTLRARDSARVLKGTKSLDGDIEAQAEHREFHPTDDE